MSEDADWQELTDEQLAEQVAGRNGSPSAMRMAKNAFEQLYGRHSRLLLAFLSSRIRRSDLEDVHQIVWRRVWEKLPDGFHGGNLRAWLYRIARNHLIDTARRIEKVPEADDDNPTQMKDYRTMAPVEYLIEREYGDALQSCLGKIDQLQADVVRAAARRKLPRNLPAHADFRCEGPEALVSREGPIDPLCETSSVMILVSLEIPDDPARLPKWLEDRLLGLDLAQLVAELSAVRDVDQPRTLEDVLGDRLPQVLAKGLAILSREQIQEFVRQPTLLLDLQTRVAVEGGSYWQARKRSE